MWHKWGLIFRQSWIRSLARRSRTSCLQNMLTLDILRALLPMLFAENCKFWVLQQWPPFESLFRKKRKGFGSAGRMKSHILQFRNSSQDSPFFRFYVLPGEIWSREEERARKATWKERIFYNAEISPRWRRWSLGLYIYIFLSSYVLIYKPSIWIMRQQV